MKPKGPAEKTIDSVGAAIGLLWDWLGDPPRESAPIEKSDPDPLDWLPDSAAPGPDGKIPAVVIDTEGENVK